MSIGFLQRFSHWWRRRAGRWSGKEIKVVRRTGASTTAGSTMNDRWSPPWTRASTANARTAWSAVTWRSAPCTPPSRTAASWPTKRAPVVHSSFATVRRFYLCLLGFISTDVTCLQNTPPRNSRRFLPSTRPHCSVRCLMELQFTYFSCSWFLRYIQLFKVNRAVL